MVQAPFDITADFLVDMSFSAEDIAGMLEEYDKDYNIGMDILAVSQLIFDDTSGYPFLVSRICKLIDERIWNSRRYGDGNVAYTRKDAWGKEGILEAVRLLLTENFTSYEQLAPLNLPESIQIEEINKMFYLKVFSLLRKSRKVDSKVMLCTIYGIHGMVV